MKLIKNLMAVFLVFAIVFSMAGCTERKIRPVVSYDKDITAENQDESQIPAEQNSYSEKLKEIFSILDTYYVDDYDKEHIGDFLAAAAVASTGDRWSYYISAEDYAQYYENNNNAYVGIGVTVQKISDEDPRLKVVSVTPGSPAETAGLLGGDIIAAVEGESTEKLGLDGTKNKIRGEEGTDVTITVQRDKETFDVTITRKMIETVVVSYDLMQERTGYIKIRNFDAHCARDTIAAIEDLRKQGAESLVFDLRFNPGGRKDELVKILDYLLPEGPLFRSVNYQGKEEVDYSDKKCLKMPMAVLVNDDSYSAAEFFAAALQEYEWATVVGTKTCGKANYQQTFRLSDGSAIAISTGHYQTPKGVTLAGIGVTPDILIEVDEDTYLDLYSEKVEKAKDEQLQAAISAVNQEKA